MRWTKATAWHGIARLLLSCEIWDQSWQPFHGCIVYRERNDFSELGRGLSNQVLKRAQALTAYLRGQFGIAPDDVCSQIAQYWWLPSIQNQQPHNLVGLAFRSLIVHILDQFGDQGITYEEESEAGSLFPGAHLYTRSRRPKVDIVARRGQRLVALLSVRWRFHHDRVDVVNEANAYMPHAVGQNRNCRFFAVLGEFSPSRLEKVLSNSRSPQFPNASITATIHFAPSLITDPRGLDENGRMGNLRSLENLIDDTFHWQ